MIEWHRQTKRALYLCNEQGFPLSLVETRFHVGDFQFSAYLKSPYIGALHQDNRLDLAEMVPNLARAVGEARRKFTDLFRERASERARIVVEDWKAQNLYPMKGKRALRSNEQSVRFSILSRLRFRKLPATSPRYPTRRQPCIFGCCAMLSSAARQNFSAF